MRVWRFLFSIAQILRSKGGSFLHQDSPRFSNALVDEYLNKFIMSHWDLILFHAGPYTLHIFYDNFGEYLKQIRLWLTFPL